MMKKYTLFVLLTLCILGINAQTVSVTSAPSSVAEGDVFKITYSVNSSSLSDFDLGTMPAGVRIEGGPMTYTQSSYQMINGHTTSSSSTTLTYFISVSKPGNIVIPPAVAVVGGKRISSRSININVTGSGGTSSSPSNRQTQPTPPPASAPSSSAQDDEVVNSNSNLLIKPILSKQKVHEQEAVVLSYKIYTKLNVRDFNCSMPDLKGFHIQKIDNSNKITLTREGAYMTAVLDQYVLYPQLSGKLEIPEVTYSILVGPNPNDPMSFFNQTSRRVNVQSKKLEVNVEPLADKPAGFTGAVGSFSVSSQVDKTEVKAGDPITYKFIIDGTGNLKLITAPVLNLPKEFDAYDPKTTDKSTLTSEGHQGSLIFDYVIVPRKEGKYTIPATSFVYYDVESGTYKTLTTTPQAITVLKGDGNTSVSDFSGEDATSDIRGLMPGETTLKNPDDHFFGSWAYFVWLIIPVLIFIALFVGFRKYAIEHANMVKMRGKKANKVATKRLMEAASLMKQNRQNEFYDEVLRALWGYVSDKLNIPVEHLSKENISDNLEAKGINYSTIETFIKAIDDCEYARYAPGDPKGMMEHVYECAMTAITDIDNMLNNKKSNTASTPLAILLLLMLFSSISVSASTKEQADEAYSKGNYTDAIKMYNDILKQGVSAEVYYNLGNACYRANKIPQAVLAYERAYRLSPGNSDIKYNLKIAQKKTIDKIETENQMFFINWYHSVINFTSADNWAILSIVCVILLLVSLVMYLFGQQMAMIKGSFYLALCSLVLFVFSTLCAFLQNYHFTNTAGAVVMSASLELKKTPADNSAEIMVLHEGTHVDIVDDSMNQWVKVHLADGREGWLKPAQIEVI